MATDSDIRAQTKGLIPTLGDVECASSTVSMYKGYSGIHYRKGYSSPCKSPAR